MSGHPPQISVSLPTPPEVVDFLGGDPALACDVVEYAIGDIRSQWEELHSLLDAAELGPLVRSLHSLRGAVATFRCEEFVRELRRLESLADAGQKPGLAHLEAAMDDLLRKLEALLAEIKPLA